MSLVPPNLRNDGVLLLNKPQGLSSNAALQRAKRLFGVKKAGHTGSLDPLATGMLPICFGEATKIAQYLLNADKCYEVVARLGQVTDTGDAMGAMIREVQGTCTDASFIATLDKFRGETLQVPPMYSALKHQGQPLYVYARKGIEIERAARPIVIDELNCDFFEFPYVKLTVRCTKGTYIRSLIEGIGDELGLGAHVTALHRVYTAGFEEMPMYTLDDLMALDADARWECVLPISRAIAGVPVLVVTDDVQSALRQGKVVSYTSSHEGLVQLHSQDGVYFGIGELQDNNTLIGKRLCAF